MHEGNVIKFSKRKPGVFVILVLHLFQRLLIVLVIDLGIIFPGDLLDLEFYSLREPGGFVKIRIHRIVFSFEHKPCGFNNRRGFLCGLSRSRFTCSCSCRISCIFRSLIDCFFYSLIVHIRRVIGSLAGIRGFLLSGFFTFYIRFFYIRFALLRIHGKQIISGFIINCLVVFFRFHLFGNLFTICLCGCSILLNRKGRSSRRYGRHNKD